jgi:predicted regulator of Ras-like GTPase activity (Roadblock/LC7/MglB family)
MTNKILSELTKLDGVKGSMIVSKDGLVIASKLNNDMNVELIGAVISAIFGGIKKAMAQFGKNDLRHIKIENGEKILMIDIGEEILVVIMDNKGSVDNIMSIINRIQS